RFAPVVENGRYVFHLPQPIDDARLCSRTRVPARMEPGVPDGRRLGVAVARLVVDGEPLALEILGDGWHGGECDAAGEFRWTNGDAALPPGRTLEVEIVHRRRYWANGQGGPSLAPLSARQSRYLIS